MEQVGIRELRQCISTAVRDAGSGRRFVITVDGRPVAQLGPIEMDDTERALATLAANRELVLATSASRTAPDQPTELWPGARIDRLIKEVRGR